MSEDKLHICNDPKCIENSKLLHNSQASEKALLKLINEVSVKFNDSLKENKRLRELAKAIESVRTILELHTDESRVCEVLRQLDKVNE